jgi:hypothetical protein
MFLKYILFRTIMKNKIQEYEIRSDFYKEFHLQLSPDLFRHRRVATGHRRSPAIEEKGYPGGMVGSFQKGI